MMYHTQLIVPTTLMRAYELIPKMDNFHKLISSQKQVYASLARRVGQELFRRRCACVLCCLRIVTNWWWNETERGLNPTFLCMRKCSMIA